MAHDISTTDAVPNATIRIIAIVFQYVIPNGLDFGAMSRDLTIGFGAL